MNNQINYYDLLQVSPNATKEIIEAAYRALQKQFHPDAGGSEELARLVNEAREILTDPIKRNRYDTELRLGQSTAPSHQAQAPRPQPEVLHLALCMACGAQNRVSPERFEEAVCGRCTFPLTLGQDLAFMTHFNRNKEKPNDEYEINKGPSKVDLDNYSSNYVGSHENTEKKATNQPVLFILGLVSIAFIAFAAYLAANT